MRPLLFASWLWLSACAPAPFGSLPTTEELARVQTSELMQKYPELAECAQGASPSALAGRGAQSLIDAWGEPDAWSISAWNALVWLIPLAPVTSWEWTRHGREVEVLVWHPAVRGYRAVAWECYFAPVQTR